MANSVNKRLSADRSAPADLEGGEKRGSRTSVAHTQNIKVNNIKDARIRVGATRAPQMTPETPGQGALGDLFDSLGKFSQGPFARALQDKHFSEIEEQAERAVFEGTSLDDIKDKNYVFEHYYNGASGRKQGVAAVNALEEDIAAQADDDLYDVDEAAKGILGQFLPRDMDPTQATNAAAVVREHFGRILSKEKARRTQKVRLDTLESAKQGTTEEADLHFKNRNFLGAMNTYEAGLQDAKNAAGISDPKNYKEYITSDIVASLKNPVNQFTLAEIAEYQKVVETYKGPNGASLWSNSPQGKRLKEAFGSALTAKSQKLTLDQELENKEIDRRAKDINDLPSRYEIEARVEAKTTSAARGATQLDTARTTRERDADVRFMLTSLVSPDTSPEELFWLQDKTDVEDSSKLFVETLTAERGMDEKEARLLAARVYGAQGVEVDWIEKEAANSYAAGDYAAAGEYLNHMRSISPVMGVGFLGVEDRAIIDYYARSEPQQGEEQTKVAISLARENFTGNRGQFTLRDNLDNTKRQFETAKIVDQGSRNFVLSAAAIVLGTGAVSVEQALAEGIRQYQAEVTMDEHNVPMLPQARVINWEKSEIRGDVRENFLKPWLTSIRQETGGALFGLLDGNEDKVRIIPMRGGQGYVITPEGKSLGIVPLREWTDKTTIIRNEKAADIAQAEQEAADVKRLSRKTQPGPTLE